MEMGSEETFSSVAPSEPEREQSLESNGLKRRRSEEGEQDLKRQRTSLGKNSPNTTEDAASAGTPGSRNGPKPGTESTKVERMAETRDSRLKSGVVEEKQRSKRLFGALLGNLNQPSDRMSKRRTEIEQRRKAELQKQDDKRIEDRQRKLVKLAEHRRKVQDKLEEENMYRRHDDMLNKARFLLTETEPRVYYRPWDLLPHQEDIIEDQTRDVKAKIDEELAEFEKRKQQRSEKNSAAKDSDHIIDRASRSEGADGEVSNASTGDPEASAIDSDKQTSPGPVEVANGQSEDGRQEISAIESSIDTIKENVLASPRNTGEMEKDGKVDDSEDDEDHVMEGDEDTVIY